VAYRLRIRSRLATDRRTLWAHASSMDGVNAELAPVAGTFERRHARLRSLFAGRDAQPPRVEWLPSA